jgi:hypothetical protein
MELTIDFHSKHYHEFVAFIENVLGFELLLDIYSMKTYVAKEGQTSHLIFLMSTWFACTDFKFYIDGHWDDIYFFFAYKLGGRTLELYEGMSHDEDNYPFADYSCKILYNNQKIECRLYYANLEIEVFSI